MVILMKNNTIEKTNIKILNKQYATLYKNNKVETKSVILYFHGGGLLYGDRNDLPETHIEKFCENNYAILSFDYRLAPKYKLPDIISDIISSINWYIDNRYNLFKSELPYFLWGRSAGAYLSLLAAREDYREKPLGILSYYGYGFMEDNWANTPNPHYCKLPKVEEKIMNDILNKEDESINNRYALYVYARQSGNWFSLIYNEKVKYLLLNYSLRVGVDPKKYPPIFLTHSFYDPDVPCQESRSIHELFPNSELFLVSSDEHDFDRFEEKSSTAELLQKSLDFLNDNLSN